MAEKLIALFFIMLGLWSAFRRKQVARNHEEAQRRMFPKTQPYDAATVRLSQLFYAAIGLIFMIVGTLMLFDLLPADS